jgi:oxygen-independent coproporphyrinogen-3 oxidase
METIYFGGGTPSLLEVSQLKEILDLFTHTLDAELTIELDPGTFDLQKLHNLQGLGFNRFSMGVQTLQQTEFSSLGRGHSFAQLELALDNLK